MNGDRIPKALAALRSAIRALLKINTPDPRRALSHLAHSLDATQAARDALALEYEALVNHLHDTLARARERSDRDDPEKH